jgi:hypothetical protein
MTTPIRPVPQAVRRWRTRLAWLRWADAAVAAAALWAALLPVAGPLSSPHAPVAALVVTAVGVAVRPVRARWRPVSGWVALAMSRGLRVGDRVWYIGLRDASVVVVTARHRTRVVIARPDLPDEGLSVRRTRVLLLRLAGTT